MEFTGGVTATVPLSVELLGLLYVTLLEQRGDLTGALTAADTLPDAAAIRYERADLALRTGQPQRVVQLTDGVTNTDDMAVLMLAARATALRQLGQPAAAVDVTKEGLRFPSRAAGARQQVRIARAHAQLDLGKRTPARTEADRVLAENANAPGLADLLTRLDTGPGQQLT